MPTPRKDSASSRKLKLSTVFAASIGLVLVLYFLLITPLQMHERGGDGSRLKISLVRNKLSSNALDGGLEEIVAMVGQMEKQHADLLAIIDNMEKRNGTFDSASKSRTTHRNHLHEATQQHKRPPSRHITFDFGNSSSSPKHHHNRHPSSLDRNNDSSSSSSSSSSGSSGSASLRRSHGNVYFPAPMSFGTADVRGPLTPSMLVVCGTDGSGTRRVVDILTSLGVLMVSEDPETFDIHGDLMGGWPPVVKPIIKAARTLNYDPATLPSDVHSRSTSALTRLVRQAEGDSHKPTSYVLAVGGALPRSSSARASGVSFGFKAPVAMTLAPYWAHLTPHFKLLHVLRDGRDIAFSANQGPVEKFYADMYGLGDRNSMQVRAIRLWSDWNSQLLAWSKAQASKKLFAESKSFGYFALHSEDLVSESVNVKYAAISDLADWVGSNLSEEDLCCLAKKGSEFLGSHDRTDRKEANKDSEDALLRRYGKWKSKVQNDPSLERALNEAGKEALLAFGYEPLRALPDEDAISKHASTSGFRCSMFQSDKCPEEEDLRPPVPNANDYAVAGVCDVISGVDYKGDGHSDLLTVDVKNQDKDACCRKCKSESSCRHFTIDPMSGLCYLKTSKGREVKSLQTRLLVSGNIV